MTWEQVTTRALNELSDAERRDAAVYLDEVEHAAGSILEIDRQPLRLHRATAVVFVDQAPQLNWGHACRYLLVGLEDGHVESVPAQFPPFLRRIPKTLRLIWKGETVPEWAIARP